MRTKTIGRWQSRGGKYWLELIENANGSFSYRHENGGGYMGFVSADTAWARMDSELQSYAFDGHTLNPQPQKPHC
jgi:hypothetical protein